MSDTSYHDSVTVETEVKQSDDLFYLNVSNFKFFGISEKAIQTELTLNKVKEIVNNNKQLKENSKNKQESLLAPFNSTNKKEITNILIEPIKIDGLGNQLIEGKNDNNNNNNEKSSKKNRKEDKKEGKKDKENLLDKKRKRPDEEKHSPLKNKTKFQEINKSKEKDKEKQKIKTLKENSNKKKFKEDKNEKAEKVSNFSEKKEKQEKQED